MYCIRWWSFFGGWMSWLVVVMLGGWCPTASLQECEKMQCGCCIEKSGIAQQGRTNERMVRQSIISIDGLLDGIVCFPGKREKGTNNNTWAAFYYHSSYRSFGVLCCWLWGRTVVQGPTNDDLPGEHVNMSRNRERNLRQCEIYSECMEFVYFEQRSPAMNGLFCGCLYNKRSELFMLPHRPTSSSSLVYGWIK